MDEKKNILLQLNTFKNLNKFSNSAWNKRGLNPYNTPQNLDHL